MIAAGHAECVPHTIHTAGALGNSSARRYSTDPVDMIGAQA
ncbi:MULTISPECIES: hypothetical protein [unclassified Nocardia]|nr:hypothetical protein OG326_04840 [Nocardia sp. NBC_01327]